MGLFKDREKELMSIIAMMTILNEANELDVIVEESSKFLKNWSACTQVKISLSHEPAHQLKRNSEHVCIEAWVLKTNQMTYSVSCNCGNDFEVEHYRENFISSNIHSFCTNSFSALKFTKQDNQPFIPGKRLDESALVIQLKSGLETFGTLYMGHSDPGFFKESTVLFYEQLAINISTAISRTRSVLAFKSIDHRYKETMDNMMEGAQIVDFDWNYLYVNDAFVKHSKYPREVLLNSNVLDLYPGIENTNIYEIYLRCFNERESIHLENEFVFPDGTVGWFDLSFQPVPEGIFILSNDISKRKMAEIKLEKQNKDLQLMLKELEQFAYIASHDLQEPLRTLTSFAGLIKKEYSGQLGERGDKYLDFILKSSDRMKDLIKGLLDYSRIGQEKILTELNCNDLLEEVLQDMSYLIEERKARIQSEKLPNILAYKLEFRLLLQNLISNAVKFSKKDNNPEIEIRVEKQHHQWLFEVKDNGIGIDAEDQHKVFIIFKRLHNRLEYEGYGIGLSFCKKIVELHGGTIWLKSTPNEGSSFYFTIPLFREYMNP